MKYFKAKRIINNITTLSFNAQDAIHYHYENEFDYYGVNTFDAASILNTQNVELEAVELSYTEIKPILEQCRMMRDLDVIIEKQIAERYSIGKELKMRDLALDDAERIAYEGFKEAVKDPIRLKKIEMGLRES